MTDALGHEPAGAFALLSQGPDAVRSAKAGDPEPSRSVFEQRWCAAKSIADRESFLHWEVAFPGVWRRWQDARPEGGFDAVIGNPPWDHIEQPGRRVVRHSAIYEIAACIRPGPARKALIRSAH